MFPQVKVFVLCAFLACLNLDKTRGESGSGSNSGSSASSSPQSYIQKLILSGEKWFRADSTSGYEMFTRRDDPKANQITFQSVASNFSLVHKPGVPLANLTSTVILRKDEDQLGSEFQDTYIVFRASSKNQYTAHLCFLRSWASLPGVEWDAYTTKYNSPNGAFIQVFSPNSVGIPAGGTGSVSNLDDAPVGIVCLFPGTFPHPEQCTKFYVCSLQNEKWDYVIQECDSGSYFDADESKCVQEEGHPCTIGKGSGRGISDESLNSNLYQGHFNMKFNGGKVCNVECSSSISLADASEDRKVKVSTVGECKFTVPVDKSDDLIAVLNHIRERVCTANSKVPQPSALFLEAQKAKEASEVSRAQSKSKPKTKTKPPTNTKNKKQKKPKREVDLTGPDTPIDGDNSNPVSSEQEETPKEIEAFARCDKETSKSKRQVDGSNDSEDTDTVSRSVRQSSAVEKLYTWRLHSNCPPPNARVFLKRKKAKFTSVDVSTTFPLNEYSDSTSLMRALASGSEDTGNESAGTPPEILETLGSLAFITGPCQVKKIVYDPTWMETKNVDAVADYYLTMVGTSCVPNSGPAFKSLFQQGLLVFHDDSAIRVNTSNGLFSRRTLQPAEWNDYASAILFSSFSEAWSSTFLDKSKTGGESSSGASKLPFLNLLVDNVKSHFGNDVTFHILKLRNVLVNMLSKKLSEVDQVEATCANCRASTDQYRQELQKMLQAISDETLTF